MALSAAKRTTTLILDTETDRLLDIAAREQGVSRSEFIRAQLRRALEQYKAHPSSGCWTRRHSQGRPAARTSLEPSSRMRGPAGAQAPAAGLEPATRRLTEEGGAAQSDELRAVEASGQSGRADDDSVCFTLHQNESSGIVNEIHAECNPDRSEGDRRVLGASTDVENAIRVAIKLAVDAGDYERAAALLDVVRRSPPKERA